MDDVAPRHDPRAAKEAVRKDEAPQAIFVAAAPIARDSQPRNAAPHAEVEPEPVPELFLAVFELLPVSPLS